MPPKLMTCSKIYLGTIWFSKTLSIKFDITMATTFWQAVFSELWTSLFLIKNNYFPEANFTYLDHFRVNFTDFDHFLTNFGGFRKIKKSKMAAVWEQNVILTSYDVSSWYWGPQWKQFWTYYLSFKFRCHSFNILWFNEWGRNPTPPFPQPPQKPGLKRAILNMMRSTNLPD